MTPRPKQPDFEEGDLIVDLYGNSIWIYLVICLSCAGKIECVECFDLKGGVTFPLHIKYQLPGYCSLYRNGEKIFEGYGGRY